MSNRDPNHLRSKGLYYKNLCAFDVFSVSKLEILIGKAKKLKEVQLRVIKGFLR